MITSKDNPHLKDLKKLQQKRFRLRTGKFAAEGEDLVAAALSAGRQPETIFCAPDAPPEFAGHERALIVDYDLLAGACALGSGARVVGVFAHLAQAPVGGGALTLFAPGVSDPGNVGTIIRSAAAFTDSPVCFANESADPYSPKALRAAMGTTFTHPPQSDSQLADLRGTIVALDASGSNDIGQLELAAPIVLAIGSERDGLGSELIEAADVVARIPMRSGGPESLNVAMAATIALYELSKGINQETTK